MNGQIRLAVVILASVLLFSCETSKFSVEKQESMVIDASKRVIFVTEYERPNGKREKRICAEPSPDAIASLTAQLAAKGSVPQGPSVELAAAFQRSVASIGLRTQTIQVLRDLLYRACEARINGLFVKDQVPGVLAGIDDLIVGLVAIDGMTQMQATPAGGTARPPDNGIVAARVVDVVKLVLDSTAAKRKSMQADLDRQNAIVPSSARGPAGK